MKTTIVEVNSFTRRIDIVVEWADLEQKFNTFLIDFSKKIKLPGFRKGKVPAKVVRRQFGPSVEFEFAEKQVQEYYKAALVEHKTDPINRATINDINFSEGDSLNFDAVFEIEPEVVMPIYKRGMKFEEIVYEMDPHDVDKTIEEMRMRQAQMKTVESGAEIDHFLRVDMQEVDTAGLPIVGRKALGQFIELTPEGPFKDNLNKLMGVKAGEIHRVELPGNDGEKVYYDLAILQVSERILPDIDDEFAKIADPSADNLDQLRENIADRLRKALDRETAEKLTRNIADHFVKNTKLEVPTSMVENYLDNLAEDMEKQGYPKDSIDRDALAEEHHESISWNIRWYLLRLQLIADEGIEVSDEAIKTRIEEIVATDESQAKQIRTYYKRSENKRQLKEDLVADALLERMKSYAKIKQVKKSSKELRKEG